MENKVLEEQYTKEPPQEEEEEGGLMAQMANIIKQKRDRFFHKSQKVV